MNEINLNELNSDELIDFINNMDPQNIDLDALESIDLRLLEKLSISDIKPEIITALINDTKMLTNDGKAYQVGAKTSRGLKIAFSLLDGSNNDKVKDLMLKKEDALKAGVAVAFNDNISVIDKCLDSIRSQVDAISKGIMSEEARYKAKYLDPMNAKINEISKDLVSNEVMQVQIDSLKKENENLEFEVSTLKDIRNENEVLISQQKEEITALTSENRFLMKESKEFDAKLESAIKDSEKNLKESLEEVDKLTKELESMNLRLEQTTTNENALKEEIKTMKANHTSEINNLNKSSMDAERKLNKEIVNLNVAKNKLESEKISLETLKDSLSTENTKLKETAAEYEKNIRDLESKVKTLSVDKESLIVKVEGKNDLINQHNI